MARPSERRAPSGSLIASAGTADLAGRRRVLRSRCAPTASTPIGSPTSASPASTACSPISTASPTADAVVVVAGMEGALASVVGGLTAAPVVAVPTSVGYGAALEGVTALLAMHASCASGVTVVGIDNGFGAACAVARMLRAMTGRTAWFHCFAGTAGDMTLGALVDAGADVGRDRRRTRRAAGRRVRAVVRARSSAAVSRATWANVGRRDDHAAHDGDDAHHAHRPARDVLESIGSAASPRPRARPRTGGLPRCSPRSRVAIHGIDPDDVELHEVGAVDCDRRRRRRLRARSRCSASTASCAARSRSVRARCAPRTASCPTRLPAVTALLARRRRSEPSASTRRWRPPRRPASP